MMGASKVWPNIFIYRCTSLAYSVQTPCQLVPVITGLGLKCFILGDNNFSPLIYTHS
jgi:hypothetical protein